jgi:hypothetical protein
VAAGYTAIGYLRRDYNITKNARGLKRLKLARKSLA